jgi:prepilin-type N-terminal cleavage/methylation domain-containing protein
MASHRRRRGADRGFTVVELIVVVVLLGVVTSAIAGAFIVSLRTLNGNFTAIDQSNASLQVTRSLTSDIQSASSTVTLSPNDAVCGGTAKLKLLTQSNPAVATFDTTVVWTLTSAGDLVRCTIVGGSTTNTYRVARGISSFTPSCSASCDSVTVVYVAAGGSKQPAATYPLPVKRRIR